MPPVVTGAVVALTPGAVMAATNAMVGGEGGTTLESLGAPPLKVGYIAVGTPKRNDKGEIINAVIVNTFYSGDSTYMYNTWYEGQPANAFSGGAIVGPGRTIDTNRYYVVFLDAIGLWGESKPSAGLGRKFPKYSYFDMVQATLGAAKTADGLQALAWFREGRLDLIEKYCIDDVRLTRDLYLYGKRNRNVLVSRFSGKPIKVDVAW